MQDRAQGLGHRNPEAEWFEITLVVDREVQEALSDALIACGAASVQTEDADADTPEEVAIFAEPLMATPEVVSWRRNRLRALLEAPPDGAHTQAAKLLAEACGIAGVSDLPPWGLQPLIEQDWVRLTQAQFQPIAIGERLWVRPSWHAGHPAGRTALVLDPGLAFGTGSHPTTRLCLEWLEAHLQGGEDVLDYGCGSGILAIAAALLGAQRVEAIDIDPQAVRATRENAKLNRVDRQLRALQSTEHHGSALQSTEHQGGALQADGGALDGFDIVVANILAAPLKLLAPLLEEKLRPGGRIILAGLLEEQGDEVAACYRRTSPAPWRTEGAWTLLVGQRRGGASPWKGT